MSLEPFLDTLVVNFLLFPFHQLLWRFGSTEFPTLSFDSGNSHEPTFTSVMMMMVIIINITTMIIIII